MSTKGNTTYGQRPSQLQGLSIWIFKILDDIRHKHSLTMQDWSKASGIPASRISELRKLFQERALINTQARVHRAFSLRKCYMLVEGLISLIGRSDLQRGIEVKLAQYKVYITSTETVILRMMSMSPAEKEQMLMFSSNVIKARGE